MSEMTGDRTLDETTERIVSELTTRLLQPLASSVTGALSEAIPTLEPTLAELQRPAQDSSHDREQELAQLEALTENSKITRQTQQKIIELQAELLKFEADFSLKLEDTLEKSLDNVAQSIKQNIDQSMGQGRSESLQAFQAIQDALAQFEQRLGQKLVTQFEQRLEQKLAQKLDQKFESFEKFDQRFERSLKNVFANVLSEDRRTLASALTPSLAPALMSSLESSLGASLASSLNSSLASYLESSLGTSLESKLGPSLRSSLETSLGPSFESRLAATLESKLAASITQTLEQTLTQTLSPAISNELSGLRDNLRDSLSESLNDSFRDTLDENLSGSSFEPVLTVSREIKRIVHDGFAASANNANNTKIILTNSLAKLEAIIKSISSLSSTVSERDGQQSSDEKDLTLLADELAGIRADLAAASERAAQDKQELLDSVKCLSDTIISEQNAIHDTHDDHSAQDITRQLLEVTIPGWEGMLRAHNQAQSRELDTLSTELTNLQNQAETTVIQALQDTLHAEFATHIAALERRNSSDRLENAKWAKSIKSVLWLLAGFAGLSILFSVAGFFH